MRKPTAQDRRTLSRRTVIAGLPLLVAGCDGSGRFDVLSGGDYGATQDSSYTVPAVDLSTIDRSLLRQEVDWRGSERPGSIVINVPERRLYLVEDGGRALRYAVGVGRDEALNFHGSAVIGRKEKWPRWTPTANMIAAMPRYRPYAGGMAGENLRPLVPLARAAQRRSIQISSLGFRAIQKITIVHIKHLGVIWGISAKWSLACL